jgi:hypothetical protein
LHELLLRYTQAVMVILAQNVACNAPAGSPRPTTG